MRKFMKVTLAVAALVLGSSGALTAPALADDPASDPNAGTDTVSAPAPTNFDDVSEADMQQLSTPQGTENLEGDAEVLAYWTQERLDSAIPMPVPDGVPESDDDGADLRPLEGETESVEEDEEQVVSEPVVSQSEGEDGVNELTAPVTNFPAINGKVFFRNAQDGNNYTCSASAINSNSKRVVLTAGHCVHGGSGGTWHENWIFVPDYHRGQRPHGTFQAKTLHTFKDWVDYGNSTLFRARGYDRDVAFVSTYQNESGQKVVNAVGGYGLQVGGSREFDVSVFGYPGNLDNGEVMWACWGRTGTYRILWHAYPSISGCDFGGGSSGGPWLYKYDNSSGVGYARTVTSFGPDDNSYIAGPYFDNAVRNLYTEAGAAN